MKTLDEIKEIIYKLKPMLEEKYKVKSLGIFGSYANNNQNVKNDLDLLVEFYEPIGLKYFELKDYLEDIFGIKIDLVVKQGVKPQLKNRILKETVNVL